MTNIATTLFDTLSLSLQYHPIGNALRHAAEINNHIENVVPFFDTMEAWEVKEYKTADKNMRAVLKELKERFASNEELFNECLANYDVTVKELIFTYLVINEAKEESANGIKSGDCFPTKNGLTAIVQHVESESIEVYSIATKLYDEDGIFQRIAYYTLAGFYKSWGVSEYDLTLNIKISTL